MCSAVYAGEEHKATQDMWLSPQSRLLADSPEGADYVFDGQGHRLIFPEGLNEGETLPLIIIGVGKSLQLKDVKLVHAASLPACIQLGSGMLLVTFPASSL
jgi:vacuolar protein sorting-associated protein 13A/C